MFDTDRPILSKEQDRLGRATFAKYLARCILDHQSPESMVIGLYGGWGVGKTSVINLVLEELRAADRNALSNDERPIILNFSPWSYSGQQSLVYSFFRRLSSALRQAEFLDNSDKIIHLLELYVSFFTDKPVPKALRPKHSWFTQLFNRKKNLQNSFGWESGRDLTQVKAELNELLIKQKNKIIIIIDNISRLTFPEINQMFKIVKSMGDFSNTEYLLSMDKKQIIHAMDQIHGSGGSDYLEKLVQMPFEIPAIAKQDLENILLGKMKKIIMQLTEDSWDKNYWGSLYYSTIKYFFDNCRDVTRYINSISFGFARVIDLVNPVDFFAITAIYTFSPLVYEGIRDNKDLFTDLITHAYEFDKKKLAEDKSRCDEIINRLGRIDRDLLLQLLIMLFPRLRSLYETQAPFYHSEDISRKNKRVCDPDVFDIYFRLSMPTGFIPDTELCTILKLSSDEEGFALALLRLNKDEKIEKFLDALDSFAIQKIDQRNISNVLDALIDSADLFPPGENNFIQFDTAMRIHRILQQLFRRFDNSQKRLEIFSRAIKKSINSIYIIVHEIIEQEKEHKETEDTFLPLEERDFSPNDLSQLKILALEKIREWAKSGRLISHPKLLAILYAWKAWETSDGCEQYVAQITEDDKGLLAFLCAAFQEPIDQAIAKLEKNATWDGFITHVDDFIPAKQLTKHAKALFENQDFEQLREREQLALLIFLDVMKVETTKLIPKTTI
jgi:predicted KAP-like P-loop ATPase